MLRITWGDLVLIIAAMSLGTIAYQLIQAEPNWATAIERIWFQGSTLIWVGIYAKLFGKTAG